MTPPELEALIAAWRLFERTPEGTPEWWERRSAALAFDDLCWDDPEAAWIAIQVIARRESNLDVLGVIAAAPMEDLLSRHGEAFIDRVEAAAHADPRIRRVLAGTWQDGMSEAVWGRVQAASGRAPLHNPPLQRTPGAGVQPRAKANAYFASRQRRRALGR